MNIGELATFRGGVAGPGTIPVGSIFAWVGGYFQNGSNGTFTNVLGNTVANANTYLNTSGIYVCDGAALNDAASPIFNGAGRYLPNLTDSRFLMGSTSAGSIGGSTSVTLAANNVPQVSTSYTPAGTVSVSLSGSAPSLGGTTTFSSTSHIHTLKTSGSDRLVVQGVGTGGTNKQIQTDNAPSSDLYATTNASSDTASVSISGGSYSVSSSTFSGTVATITVGSASPTAIENRPLYLSVFYVMRVK